MIWSQIALHCNCTHHVSQQVTKSVLFFTS